MQWDWPRDECAELEFFLVVGQRGAMNQSVITAPLRKAESVIGPLALSIVVVFFVAWLFMSIWNSVLYERIEGVDKITFWDSAAILLIPACFIWRPIF